MARPDRPHHDHDEEFTVQWGLDDDWIRDPSRLDAPPARSFDDGVQPRLPPPALSCRHLVKVYPTATGRVLAVRGIDLDVEAGVATAVVGPSGSGKSSLLRMLAALDAPTAGVVEIDGVDLLSLRPKARAIRRAALLTHVHQRPSDNLLGHLTARQQLRRLVVDDDDRVDDVLSRLGLEHRADHVPADMSGGEQQRLAFARAGVAGHRLVIADEPTAQLDGGSVTQVLAAIDDLVAHGATVIVATHDQRVLPHMRQIVSLRDGAVASISIDGSEQAVIDRAGRLQLPPELRAHFPSGRATFRWDPDDNELRIKHP